MTQRPLIPDVAPPPAPRKRGRGATPRVEKTWRRPQANPAGRRVLKFRYRPLRAWPPRHVALAEELLAEYFDAFGGFNTVDDAIMKAWVEALDRWQPHQVRWAIAGKYRALLGKTPQETEEKRKFTAAAVNAPRHFEQWLLAYSEEYKAELAAHDAAAGERYRQALAAQRRAAERDQLDDRTAAHRRTDAFRELADIVAAGRRRHAVAGAGRPATDAPKSTTEAQRNE